MGVTSSNKLTNVSETGCKGNFKVTLASARHRTNKLTYRHRAYS